MPSMRPLLPLGFTLLAYVAILQQVPPGPEPPMPDPCIAAPSLPFCK